MKLIIDKRQYKADIDTAYECGKASVLSIIEEIKVEILEESSIDYPICDEIFEIIDKHIAEVK